MMVDYLEQRKKEAPSGEDFFYDLRTIGEGENKLIVSAFFADHEERLDVR